MPFRTRTLVIAAGGALETALLPYYVVRLLTTTSLSVRVVLSPHALDFVTPTALQGLTEHPVYTEQIKFHPLSGKPMHLAFADTDLLLVYPATCRVIAEAALGIVSCPVTRVIAFSPKEKVIMVPYLHTAHHQMVYREHLGQLRRQGCEVVMPSDNDLCWKTESAWVAARRIIHERLELPTPNDAPITWNASSQDN
ncbi:Flavoprotein [Synechococcus sp. PCC 7335]|uniref:flavoprotein n=1 Tax=Synechococcus sp. (strain ATCC 29403 / PCC 7335) TaxID=91464 RepID=UPI00017EC456|nr:flavoprotein [Synechococcus sp. PCC 7335]EDX82958.1 Flavoprotein [Synechococcus sp. PCC 7335]